MNVLQRYFALMVMISAPCFAGGVPASIATSSPASVTVAVNGTVTLSAVVKDSSSNGVSGASVTFMVPSTGSSGTFANGLQTTTSLTNASGIASAMLTVNATPGNFTATAGVFLDSFTGFGTSFSITIGNAGGAASMTAVAGTTPQSAQVGTGFQNLAVKVTDSTNTPVPNVNVTFTAPPSGASVLFGTATTKTAVTDNNGIASVAATANSTAGGPYIVTAQSGALQTSFSLTNTAGSTPASIAAQAGTTPQTALPGTAFQALSVRVADTSNQPLAGVSVTFTAPASGASGTFSNGANTISVPTNASGIAAAAFTANQVTGSYSVSAVAGTLIATFSLTNGSSAIATLTAQPQSTPQATGIGGVFPQPLAALVKDGAGNPVPGVAVTFFAPVSGPSGTFSTGTNTITVTSNAAGIASAAFTANSIVGGPYSVSANTPIPVIIITAFSLTNTNAVATVVTQNPTDVSVAAGATVTFAAAATGNPTPTVQWQQSTDGGAIFTNIVGASSGTYVFTATASQNGYKYRAVFTNINNSATTTAATLTVATGATIRSANPVIPSFLGNAGFSSNMYVEIYGSNFTSVTRTWAGADFNGAIAPTTLEGVSVKINNKNAAVYFVSPGQINVNAPDDSTTGVVNVQVFTSQGASNIVQIPRFRISPTLQTTPQFAAAGKQYVVALTPDFTKYIGPTGLISGLTFVKAKPGDVVSIYALGAGPTIPASQSGLIAAVNSPLALPYQVKIGGIQATVPFAGLLAGTVGLYQLNVVIPNVAPGDQTIEFIVDGIPNSQSLYITVGP